MNEEKVSHYIGLIDKVINLALERRCLMQTKEFHEKCLNAGWITRNEMDLGLENLKKKYEYIFNYDYLDKNIIEGMYFMKCRLTFDNFESKLNMYPKGKRGGRFITRGLGEWLPKIWGEELYGDTIYEACIAVEDYYLEELE
jgi:hypothetical protein